MTLMGGTSLDDNIKNNFNIFRKYQDCKALKLEPTTPKMYTPTFKGSKEKVNEGAFYCRSTPQTTFRQICDAPRRSSDRTLRMPHIVTNKNQKKKPMKHTYIHTSIYDRRVSKGPSTER
ncbi:unnamed protein product [Ceratitis capitata]|uniref:(Mediterranean fruit fly) hypothetical protein n=1 Tax=Ceratitis capitata TaxID=7213 RepID=A0A811U252_CERCA|nr:unnamed protein product [Ceratitis capitata]